LAHRGVSHRTAVLQKKAKKKARKTKRKRKNSARGLQMKARGPGGREKKKNVTKYLDRKSAPRDVSKKKRRVDTLPAEPSGPAQK